MRPILPRHVTMAAGCAAGRKSVQYFRLTTLPGWKTNATLSQGRLDELSLSVCPPPSVAGGCATAVLGRGLRRICLLLAAGAVGAWDPGRGLRDLSSLFLRSVVGLGQSRVSQKLGWCGAGSGDRFVSARWLKLSAPRETAGLFGKSVWKGWWDPVWSP